MKFDFGPWEPDKINSDYPGLFVAEGVYAGSNGYRAIPGPLDFTEALPGDFQGGGAAISSEGTSWLFAATPSGLYRYSGAAWTNVFLLSTSERYRFERFDDSIIAVFGGRPRALDLISGTVTTISTAPISTHVSVIKDITVVAGDPADTNLVRWSGFGNPLFWTEGVNQSGAQPIHEGGQITGLVGGEFGLVFQRSRVTRMTYIGAPDVFQFDEVEEDIGCIAADSIVHVGGITYFLSERGFMKTDGSRGGAQPIGFEKFDNEFTRLYPRSDLNQIYGAFDPRLYHIIWSMPGTPGTLWIYNILLERVTTARANVRGVVTGFSSNISLDDLNILYPGGLETIPYSLDSDRFKGGEPFLLLAMNDRKLATLSGANLPARLRTGYLDINGGRDSCISRVRPKTDATSGITVRMTSKRRSGDVERAKLSGSMRLSGDLPVISRGMYQSFDFNIAQGTDWSFIQGFVAELTLGGAR
jgi:hypothetical protein